MPEMRQMCTFRLERLFCGIDVKWVREVLRQRDMTPVPLAAHEVSGLINLRGQIVTAIDLRRRLGLPDRTGTREPMNIVAFGTDGSVSFQVDDIDDVMELPESSFELPPETVPHNIRHLLEGVYKLDGKLLHVLRVESLLDIGAGGAS
jgi:purine-binding chemotaxis protein CheW